MPNRLIHQLPDSPERDTLNLELQHYYHGIPSRPRYLAGSPNRRRVSTTPYPDEVHLFPVSATSSICLRWRHEISAIILEVLDDSCPEAVCVDLLKIGPSESDADIVVWIGAKPSLSSIAAEELVAILDEKLRACEIAEAFRVEVRTTTILNTVGLVSRNDYDPRVAPYATPFMASMGLGLSCESQPTRLGSGGIFLRNGSSPTVFVLTCHHVVSSDPNGLLPGDTAQQKGEEVYVSNDVHVVRELEVLKDAIMTQKRSLKPMQYTKKRLAREGPPKTADGTVDKVEAEEYYKNVRDANRWLEVFEQELKVMEDCLAAIEARYSDQHDRLIGHVHCHPPIRIAQGEYCEDWGLVALNDNAIPSEGVANKINLEIPQGPHRSVQHILNAIDPYITALAVGSIMTDADINDRKHTVFKNGAMSGITSGTSSPARSFVRKPFDGGAPVWSLEVPVIGTAEVPEFSKPGDSGAVAVDGAGRILGMVTSGAGEDSAGTERKDVSYLTPMWWLLERLQAFGFDPQLVT